MKQHVVGCPRCLQQTLTTDEWLDKQQRPDLAEGLLGVHLAYCQHCGYETEVVSHATIRRSLASWQTGSPGMMS